VVTSSSSVTCSPWKTRKSVSRSWAEISGEKKRVWSLPITSSAERWNNCSIGWLAYV
jgi:hypothetical protein